MKKAETESKVTREALAKQQADAKALAEKNQQLVTQLKQKAQQADKIQASLAEQTAKLAQKKITLESELATAKKNSWLSSKQHRMFYQNNMLRAKSNSNNCKKT
nr:Uncharacterised protein [Providencia rettgeri]